MNPRIATALFVVLSATVVATLDPTRARADAPSDDAAIVGASFPASMTASDRGTFVVTVRNTGAATWDDGWRLGVVGDGQGDAYAFIAPTGAEGNRVHLGRTVGPGESVQLTIPVIAPGAPRSYAIDFQMIHEGVAWIGGHATATVVVAAPAPVPAPAADDAAIAGTSFPATMQPGEAGTFSVAVKNSGSATWNDGWRLGVVGDGQGDAFPFIAATGAEGNRVHLAPGKTVAPGQTYRFSFAVIAPAARRSYSLRFQMIHEGVAWIGQEADAAVVVAGGTAIDASSLAGKLLMGYQGWFGCAGDGAPRSAWTHWSRGGAVPDPSNVCVDLWPDTRELDPDELFDTRFTYRDGSTAKLFSSHNPKTVRRHFRWMKDYGIDGVTIGRFVVGVRDPAFLAGSRTQLELVRAACEEHGRVFMIAYDITGEPEDRLVSDIERDWAYLVDTVGITGTSRYLEERGRPLVMLWGFGAADRPGTPAQALELLHFFHDNPDPRYRASVMGGVPLSWRTLGGGSKSDPAWASVYRAFDVLNPWSVGAFANETDARSWYADVFAKDAVECQSRGIGYVPVVFPGFSWKNLQGGNGVSNAIPRLGGRFYWSQVSSAARIGATAVLNAMFDECDEGTAMFKVAATRADLPVQGELVPLDADGIALPSDWYLRLAGEAAKMIRGEIPVSDTIPISP